MVMMEVVEAYKHTIGYKGANYNIIMLCQRNMHELYIEPSDGSYQMEYMFAVPASDNTKEEAMALAIANVQDYLPTFLLERWI